MTLLESADSPIVQLALVDLVLRNGKQRNWGSYKTWPMKNACTRTSSGTCINHSGVKRYEKLSQQLCAGFAGQY